MNAPERKQNSGWEYCGCRSRGRLADRAGDLRQPLHVRAHLKEGGGDAVAGQDIENRRRAFAGAVVEGQGQRGRSRGPRHTEGPNTADERPRTAQARKAAAPAAAAPVVARAFIEDLL